DESVDDSRTGGLRLNPNQATVSFDFRSLDFIDPSQIRYSYMLSGINDDWSTPRNIDNVNYANLPAGRYTFRVKAFKGDGDAEGVEGESVTFRVPRPMWCRGWAIALYLLGSILIVVTYQRWLYTKLRMQNDLRIKQQEKEQSERIHNERINLFTNFSHELRTPLSLIKTPLEDLIAHGTFPDKIRNSLRLMHDNTERLLQLVNQLLDFRKQETGSMKIKVAEGDFAAFTEEIVVAFRELAASRGIEIDFRPESRKMSAVYDPIMEKVLFNLLSNALKNTPEGGQVVVRLTMCEPKRIRLEVIDTGCGIAPDELNRIFDPFYQTTIGNTTGTGIGLSLTKGIVELHHGTITVESAPERGSLFRVEWPAQLDAFAADERDEKMRSVESLSLYLDRTPTDPTPAEQPASTAESGERYTILVADDNRELRKYIRDSLCDRYRVIEASDGDKAVRLTLSHLPHLVVSDVMMPGKDGIEVCRMLKNDLRTSHIPVILLTACSTMTQIEDGLKIGADDYITKPFNMEHLKLRIANLLHMREHLREMFGKPFELNGITYESITSPDERFLQKLYALMKESMSDPTLNLDRLCSEIGMSRTSMYYKIKTLTDLTPTEFIRNHRLQTAARLLKEKKIPISEVSVIVGFNNHSYFSNCFRKMFGCAPSEYGESHV
ncbi:MAG: response regulator, partial [Alistipes sp.]|nr:response regulator [Alistipes sp.]